MEWKASVLVVANRTADSDDLIEALRERAERSATVFTLLVPATAPGAAPRAAASRQLERALERIAAAGLEARGHVGPPDPVTAVLEAWSPADFDEIVVSTLPTASSRWLMIDLPHRVERLTGARVTHVTAQRRLRRPAGRPAPGRPEHYGPLEPLAALKWNSAGAARH